MALDGDRFTSGKPFKGPGSKTKKRDNEGSKILQKANLKNGSVATPGRHAARSFFRHHLLLQRQIVDGDHYTKRAAINSVRFVFTSYIDL